jgi:hypothetical protein
VFTRTHHWSLSWARCIQSITSNRISLRSILILSSYLRQGLPSGLFRSGLPTEILYAFLISPMRATCPAHLIVYDLFTLIPGGGWAFFSSPLRPERLWGPPSLLSNAYQGLFPWGYSGRGVKLTTHHLVPWSKNEWSYTCTPLIRLHGVVLKAQGQFYLFYLLMICGETLKLWSSSLSIRFSVSSHLGSDILLAPCSHLP